ncbi:MAG TPA: PIN domain-containing protein [Tepidanaerobacter syntrophicus]|uniref:PIN domain-containing protein n=1 Tax=Tepidanaerobacter syntrophicus TaxID=224999 RepID=UPI001762E8A3|nr:PIN domain-containing protein [Tepidanaerobacter syntrophicus]HHV82890.1 PIN domain-containing protein [Tepidanaerobacter syntrophicus]
MELQSKVLIDTSIWIEYFRGNAQIGEAVDLLIDAGSAYITGPIIAELIQGIKNKKQAEELLASLKALPYVDIRKSDWSDIGFFSLELRKKGIAIPFTDAVITCMAIKNHLCIYSLDKHFDLIDGLVKFQ